MIDWTVMRIFPKLAENKSMHWPDLSAAGFCLAIALSLLGQSNAFSQQPRTWKDSSGSFSIDAVLTSQDETTVGLRTVDGRAITVPKSRLSQSDLDYLKSRPAMTARPTAPAAERNLTVRLSGPQVAGKSSEVLSDFLSRLGVPVFIDRAGLKQVGMTPDSLINAEMRAPSLSNQLDLVLAPLKLTWYRLRTVLVVTSKKTAQKHAMETLVYRIPVPRNDHSAMMKKLHEVVPTSWEVLGGPGSVVPLPGLFVIRQTGEVHRQLASQLQVRSLPHRYVHPLDSEMVSIDIANGGLDDFAKQLQAQLNRSVVLFEPGADETRLTVNLLNVSAADALDLVLTQSDFLWVENPNGLELLPDVYARERFEERRVTIPMASPQISSYIRDAIMTLVEPRSWKPLGGAGQIEYSGGKSFQVSQTQPNFRELDQLIADLGGPG